MLIVLEKNGSKLCGVNAPIRSNKMLVTMLNIRIALCRDKDLFNAFF